MTFRWPLWGRYREISRLRQVAEILAKNGLGFLAENLGIRGFPHLRGVRQTDEAVAGLSVPERLRRTIEELGPTFIKLGQFLSTRPDVLPIEYIRELERLQDSAPPISMGAVNAQIEAELGAPLTQVFDSFDPHPLAAASIGQVHRAVLRDGRPVVVKVQRPGADRVVNADLDLLRDQVRFLEGRISALRERRLSEIVEEFSLTLRDELDYRVEGRNAEGFRRSMGGDPGIAIPLIHWEWTTQRVLTMQEIEGIKISDISRLREEGHDLSELARTAARAYLKQIFLDGFFHADPHPANLLVTRDALAFVDFGIVGYLTADNRLALGDLFIALLDRDVEGIIRSLLDMDVVDQSRVGSAMRRDISRFLVRFYGLALEDVQIGELLNEAFGLAFRYRGRLPADLALLAKTLVMLEGLGRQLDPSFILVEEVRPFAAQLVRERLSLRELGGSLAQSLRDASRLARSLPRRVDDLWSQLDRGELTIGIDLRRRDELMGGLNHLANRLAFSIVVAGLIVGSSVVIHAGGGVRWEIPFTGIGLPLAEISFVLAGVMGAWLLISIVRSRGL